jgi:hypothetical protein
MRVIISKTVDSLDEHGIVSIVTVIVLMENNQIKIDIVLVNLDSKNKLLNAQMMKLGLLKLWYSIISVLLENINVLVILIVLRVVVDLINQVIHVHKKS